jgi:Chaperone of endosialidase
MKSAVRLNPVSPLLFMTLVYFTFSALVPNGFAVVPPPDGGYPGFTTAEGQNALKSLTTGAGNTALGWSSLFSIATANFNTAVGAGTLALNTADQNTATGAAALLSNSSGFQNTANGAFALLFNTTGSFNTAIGDSALYSNLNGIGNTATGASALQNNTTGGFNTAMGNGALLDNTAGSNNTATGTGALGANTMGEDNTAHGFQALFSNVDGNLNTAVGWQALQNNTSGIDNIALGADAGLSLTTGSHNIDIGDSGVAGESGTIRIGNGTHHTQAFIAGISGVTVPGGVAVIIDVNGHLGTNVSSARFKDEIKPMDKASETILALKPVTFRYKKELDPNGIPQFGLVAEDVAKVNPDLVARDAKGELYTVRYEAVNAMLLNEFLKEHATVQELKKEIAALKAGLQSLSAQIDLGAPPLQTVVNNH